MVTETSIQSYKEIKENIGSKQKIVLNALKTLEVANNKMIANFTKFPINSVTGRMNELREMKLVTYSHDAPCPYSKRKTMFWILTKWGKEMSDFVVNLKEARLIYKPYLVDYGLDLSTFKARSKDVDSKSWHNVEIVIYGNGTIKSICDCYDWNETRNKQSDCKHISALKELLKKDNEL